MSVGCVHGRFQPFHNGHFEYFKAAYERSSHLIVGVTQYELDILDTGSPAHRMHISENPFSYWERSQIIWAAVEAANIPRNMISVVPFPIHEPQQIRNYVDANCVMYTTIYDKWNLDKIRRLRENGYEVCVLWRRRVKEFEGKAVRAALRASPPSIRPMVPAGAYNKIIEINGRGLKVRD